jgi:hypothetical protein
MKFLFFGNNPQFNLYLAPAPGLEPGTTRLTVECSAN